MEEIIVQLKNVADNSYPIVIGSGAFNEFLMDAGRHTQTGRYCIITDSYVKELYEKKIAGTLGHLGDNAEIISFPHGECNKNLETVENICERMAQKNLGRDTTVVSLGGGVVGDVAGFVASIYARGLSYVQIPTTLLAMVDSSIGGKTGVDLDYGKNLVGSFYQPRKVYIDPDFLTSLDKKEFSNGLAEIIKYGAIADKNLFTYLEGNMHKILKKNKDAVTKIIKESCVVKKSVVEKDEKETGLRMVLNFGHTIGHAIEKLSGYSIQHGEAISVGMIVESEISRMKGLLNEKDMQRIKEILASAGLRTKLPDYNSADLVNTMKIDKKAREGKTRYVLLNGIGSVATENSTYAFEVEEKIVTQAIERLG